MYEIKKMGRKRRAKANDQDGERGGWEKYMLGGYYGLSADHPPLLYWFLALSAFLPYRHGGSAYFRAPPTRRLLYGGRKSENKPIDGEEREGGPLYLYDFLSINIL